MYPQLPHCLPLDSQCQDVFWHTNNWMEIEICHAEDQERMYLNSG